MVVFVTMLSGLYAENLIGHFLTASIISVPAAIMYANIMLPSDVKTEDERIAAANQYKITVKHPVGECAGHRQLGAKAVICPQMIERIGCGDGFGHTGRRKALGLVFRREQTPVCEMGRSAAMFGARWPKRVLTQLPQ